MSGATETTPQDATRSPSDPARLDWRTGDVAGHVQLLGENDPRTHLARAVAMGIKNPETAEGRAEYIRRRRVERARQRQSAQKTKELEQGLGEALSPLEGTRFGRGGSIF